MISIIKYVGLVIVLSVGVTAKGKTADPQVFDFRCEHLPIYALGKPDDLVISEVVVKSDTPDYLSGQDWIELQNTGNAITCLGFYSLQDSNGHPTPLPHVQLKPKQFYVIPATNTAPPNQSFSLPFALGKQDSLTLKKQDVTVDHIKWEKGEAKQGRSWGRLNNVLTTLYPTPNYTNVPYQLFSENDIFTVKIHIDQDKYQHLLRHPVAEKWYKADFEFNGAKIKDVAVSTKGSATLRHIAQLRPGHSSYGRYSFKVDFNKFKEQKFIGMKRLHFNSGYGDPTFVRDAVAYKIFREVGMPASRLSFVEFWIAGRRVGLYQMIEPVDGEYVERYFPDDQKNNTKGDLYKAFTSLQWQEGDDLKKWLRGRYKRLKLITNDETLDTEEESRALKQFLKSINSGSAKYIDTDNMVRYIAAMTLISNYDSYFANLGNYFLYEHRSIDAFTMLPWDFNLSLGRSIKKGKDCEDPIVYINHPTIPPMNERPMVARVLEQDNLRAQYHAHLSHLIQTIFNSKDMRVYIQSLRELIDEYIKRDTTSFYTYKQWQQSFEEIVENDVDYFGKAGPLLPFIDARSENVRKQLSGELPAGSITSGPCDISKSKSRIQ